MRKLLYLFVLVAGVANAQIVNIPDANFKAKLIALGVDTNADGNIQESEALVPTTLNLNQSNINDITGIESFTNLQSLDCNFNQFTSLNVSNSPNLVYVNCFNNQLSSLNVSGLTSLESINCGNNNLTSLNVSGLINLEALNCYNNQLTSLNVNGLIALQVIDCSTNQITSLNVNGLTNLIGLYCYNNLIPSLTVTGLPNLINFDCSNNVLTSLNVSNLNQLQVLYCFGNQLPIINFSGIPALKWLDCHNNQIPSLDVSSYSDLIELKCHNNNINTLNVSGLTSLQLLYCYNNQLNTLDVVSLTSLEELNCGSNQITTIDLSLLTNLVYFQCDYNQFTTLDLSNNPITEFYCNDNTLLETVFMKNGAAWNPGVSIECFIGCSSLEFVCVDENEVVVAMDAVDNANLINTVVSSYCSFVPGGDYNSITGTVSFDANNNGCDANDLFQPNIRVDINDGTDFGASFTSVNGNYEFYTQTGSFAITPSIENPTWFNFTPSSVSIPFTNNSNNSVTQNFCLSANGIHPDVEVVIAPNNTARPGFDAVYQLVYKNKGNQTLTGNIEFTYDETLLDFVSSNIAPTSQTIGILAYDYTNLLPFESRSFEIILHVNAPTDTPPVNIGDQLSFTATVNPILGDEIPSDNTFRFNQTVFGAYDPNEIVCIEGNMVSPSEIGNYLHYVINFENTGNAQAENIVVREVIDVSQFDVNSLQLMNSSAPVTARLTGNVAEFIFSSIHLEAGGHGNILLKMKTKNTLVEGDSVSKKVNIYFDYNFPVETLPENTLFQALSNPDVAIDASISVFPNPSKDRVNVNCASTIKSIQLYDIQGRLLQTSLVNKNQTDFDMSNQSNGVYFLKVISENGIGVKKIVRE
ncbi:T9SS type A sorting domain-containing protein [Flavobacterium sp. 25HG05S-40]|uniref:T9SS type A sorting domain-containing protein n=1 Tax=Flavobacterium sp. 25HG05S-40 TaxID=3458682 RepID=UPI0040443A02